MTEPSASIISFTSGDFTNNSTSYVKDTSLTTTTEVYYKRSNNASGYGIKLEHQSDGSTKVYANAATDGSNAPEQLVLNGGTPAATVEITSSNIGQTLEGQEASSNTNWVFTLTSAHLWSGTPPSGTGTEGVNTPYVTWHFPSRSCGSTTYVSVTHTEATTNGTTYTVHDETGLIGAILVGTASDASANFPFTISARTLRVMNASSSQTLSTRVFTCPRKKVHLNFW